MSVISISQAQIPVFTFAVPQGGAWMAELPTAQDDFFRISWIESGQPQRARPLYAATTIKQLLTDMVANNVPLPSTRFQMDLDAIATEAGINNQFSQQAITNAELIALGQIYGAKNICIALGIFDFVARYYLLQELTLADLSEIFLNFRDTNRVGRAKIVGALDFLLSSGDITQAQYNSFLNQYDNP